MTPTAPRRIAKYRFLDRRAAEDIPSDAVPLEGAFTLTRPRFEPLTSPDVPVLEDGERPTQLGRLVMEWWGKVHELDWQDCPTDLVRAFEAVSASNVNIDRLQQMMRSGVLWERNHAGLFSAVTLDVLVPVVGPATVQPRGNTTYGRLLRERHGESLIHEIGDDLSVVGQSADHFNHIRNAQLDVIKPTDYSGERRDFVDSLALQGIREPLRGFAYQMRTRGGEGGHLIETDDGFTRAAVSQHLISTLLDGLPADLSRVPWHNGDGTMTVRGWSADTIAELHDAIAFDDAPFDVWPRTETTAGIAAWVRDASDAAQAVMRVMTARMTIGIAARPYSQHSTHDVVYADMARFHVKGHQPAPWNRQDDEAFKARTIVTNLAREGFIDRDQADVFLGAAEVRWRDDPEGRPYRNRVVATVDTMVRLVVDDPHQRDRYPAVRSNLKALEVPNSPTQAASAAASLAAQVAGLEDSGEVGGFTAMLRRSFSNSAVRQLAEHEGDWTMAVVDDLEVMVARSHEELSAVLGTSRHSGYLGPNMRALALLGMVAHGMNPKLTEFRKPDGVGRDGGERTIRWPSSLTTSGRGGRAGAGAADAHVVVFNMARSPRGLDQLEVIVRSAIDHDEPVLPLDPETGAPLLEDALRLQWNKHPRRDGTPYTPDEGSGDEADGGSGDGDTGDDEPTGADGPGVSDAREWNHQMTIFRDELRAMASKAAVLGDAPAGPDVLQVDPDEWDPDDPSLARMVDRVGIEEHTADGFDDDVEAVRRFFSTGVIAWLRSRTRS